MLLFFVKPEDTAFCWAVYKLQSPHNGIGDIGEMRAGKALGVCNLQQEGYSHINRPVCICTVQEESQKQ